MAGVSREQIARAKEISIEDYILTHEPNNVKRVGRTLYLKDHDSLRISNGLWKWASRDVGGKNVIDYLIIVRGYGFVDAVRHLAGEEIAPFRNNAPRTRQPPAEPAPERVPFKLPRRADSNDRVIAYLQSRGISKALIQECIRNNILYESADYHNAVFIGRDEHGKAHYASMRGTLGDFKLDVESSDKSYGFCLPPDSPKPDSVAVFESPIDALSHKMIEPRYGGYRLSLGCTALLALTRFLEQHPEIKNITVCTDNDEAGDLAAAKIAELTDYRVTRSRPPAGKDWNEALQLYEKGVKPLEDARKDIRFITSGYDTLFTVKDGEKVRFINGFGDDVQDMKCRFIDEMHVTIIGKYHNDYHICELAELIERNGSKFEPIPGQKPMIDVIAAAYGEPLKDVSIPMTEAALRKLVGGKYEAELLYVDGQGINGRYGPQAHDVILRGKDGIVVCGVGGENNTPTSLHPYWAQKFKRELSPAVRPTPEKADFLGKIDKFKEKTAAQAVSAAPAKTRDASL